MAVTECVLAVDAGTTGVTALTVARDGTVLSRGYAEFAQHFPRPGWVEHVPEEIWQALLRAARSALRATEATPVAIGVTNQRETAVLWDRASLAAPRPAIVWQDRRTAALCAELARDGDRVCDLTGLRLDPYFTGTKLAWLARHEPQVWDGVVAGRTAIGTVDSYVVARLTGGAHVTDAGNASRTLLLDISTGSWSAELGEVLGVPLDALPAVIDSSGCQDAAGRTSPEAFLGLDLPIAGIAGDQQAALFGQTCFAPGEGKCTYGTGSFVLTNTGPTVVRSGRGLLSTVAWRLDGELTYALEGSIFVTGAAVQWLRDGLGLIGAAPEIEALARTVPDSGGVVFVPALTGLGAPDWDPDARGLLIGLTRGTSRAHVARATLEAIAYEVRDVTDAMLADAGEQPPYLTVDGGASDNDLLCQLQADQLGRPVRRAVVRDTTALGAAFLAGLGMGFWSSLEEIRATWQEERRFAPTPGARDDGRHAAWRRAVERAKGWAADAH